MGKCVYVLKPAEIGKSAVYCGKKTGYTMPLDDDNNRHRIENPFCDEHQAVVDAWNKAHPDEEE